MKLSDYLNKRNMSYAEFADLGGWKPSTVFMWLAEDKDYHRNPNRENMLKIAELTKNWVKPADFY